MTFFTVLPFTQVIVDFLTAFAEVVTADGAGCVDCTGVGDGLDVGVGVGVGVWVVIGVGVGVGRGEEIS